MIAASEMSPDGDTSAKSKIVPTAAQKKGPAATGIAPDHGSIHPGESFDMNAHSNITAKAKAASASRGLDYRDLESELITAANMAEIACDKVEGAQSKFNKTASGYHLSDQEMQLISFAIYHTSDLINAAKAKWNEVHDATIAARKAVSA